MAQVKLMAAAAAAALVLAAGAARADGDPKNGEKIYKSHLCFGCHQKIAAGGKGGVGPNLHGVIGRKAGEVQGSLHSDALKNSGIVWSEDNLEKWAKNPKEMVPDTVMQLPPPKYVTNEKDAEDLVAYIKQESSK